eukprot:SAG31_NODE_3533_length_4149_cov_5.847901_2_plen_65_part_00
MYTAVDPAVLYLFYDQSLFISHTLGIFYTTYIINLETRTTVYKHVFLKRIIGWVDHVKFSMLSA